MHKVLVWDWPTRIGHWLMALAFVVAYATGDNDDARWVHVLAGGALVGVAVFRLLWGLLGTRHARFIEFIDTPQAAWHYLLSLRSANPQHFTGHNPAGGYAILALLLLAMLAAMTGWPMYQDLAGEWLEDDWLEDLHEGLVNFMLLVVLVHLVGVVVGSRAHRENLPRAMVTGYKLGQPDEAISSASVWAVPILLACAACAAWLLSR